MAGSDRKAVTLFDKRVPATPSRAPLRALRVASWSPWANVLAAQDTIPASTARIIASHTMLGVGYHVGSGTDPAGTASPAYPRADQWATVLQHTVRLTPGAYLEAHGWALPSGMTQRFDGALWQPDGARGRVRVVATFRTGAETSGPHTWTRSLAGSGLDRGAAPDPAAAALFDITPIVLIGPDGITSDQAVLEDFSEWTEVDIEVDIAGSPRIGDLFLVERSLVHVADYTTPSTVHAYQVGGERPQQPQTLGPRTQAPQANESRFGTERLLEAASRQNERIGPRLLSWSAWRPDQALAPFAADQTVDITGSTSPVDILDPSVSTWSPDNAGFAAEGGAYAAAWGLSDPSIITGHTLVPVWVEVDASYSDDDFSGASGIVRVQSSTLEWVDVAIPSGSRTRVRAYGWLSAQREGDSPTLMQIFGICDAVADTLQVYNVEVGFGHF